MAVDLKSHPGRNPDYFRLLSERNDIILANRFRRLMGLPTIPTPPQPNKYKPHTGAKQKAKAAARVNGGVK